MNAGEPEHERWVSPRVDRRSFLIGAAAAAAAVAAGCSTDSDGAEVETGSDAQPQEPVTLVDAPAPSWVTGPVFTLGVASGDPTSKGVILWTRLALDPTADDGASGMPDRDVDIAWETSEDEDFTKVLVSEVVSARADHGHAVHVDVPMAAGRSVFYRFRLGDETSPVGQTITLPDGSPDAFGLAVVNCQMYEGGAFGAYRNLLDEDIDLVAHLGDYIYEYPGGEGEGRHSLPNRMLETVEDYRLRYASYKLDPDLQAAHARFPFVVTWDDHEVANNYMDDTVPGNATAAEVEARKAAAYQAWWENMPVRLDPPSGSDLAVYRDFTIGDLARLYLLDERQDAAEPPCRDAASTGLDYGNCDDVAAEDRTRLGADQEAWLEGSLADSTARWNLLGNPVVLAGIDAGKDEPAFYLDTWDGYPDARKRLITQLAAVDNPVVLTGDYHAGMVLDVHEVPFDQDSPVVAPEFMAPPISSALFDADVTARTPQLRQQINEYGYLVVAVTPDELTATFRVVDDVADPDTAVRTAATWTVAAGNPVAEQS